MDKWYVITYNHTEYTEVIGLTKTREQAEAFVKESVEKMLYDNRPYYGDRFEFAKKPVHCLPQDYGKGALEC
jgi:hypothetical protein